MPTQTRDSRARKTGTKPLTCGLMALHLLQLPLQAALAAGVAPTTSGVSLDAAANGVPIVNIAKPNGAGISRNSYTSFNVGGQGLILNNSAQPVNTQLGGYITGNANLGAGSARLILNEVTAPNPSQLKGYLEVAGKRAGVVVANPYGITCNGCGFINTSQATLSTGTPRWNNDGSLAGFEVRDGLLRIEGEGLNARNTDGLALYARGLELNADLYAQTLSVVTGANTIDANSGNATTLVSASSASGYAIDSSALGGMYANTIRLVGTEAGLGMRLSGPIAALTGQLEILGNGDVQLARASAGTSLSLQSNGQLRLTDQASAGADISLRANALTLDNTAQLSGDDIAALATTASLAAGSALAARGDFVITAQDQQLDGSIGAAGVLTLTGTEIRHRGEMASGGGLFASATSFTNAGRIDVGGGLASLDITTALLNAGGTLRHAGNSLLIRAGSLANGDGEIASNGTVSLTLSGPDALDNASGRLQGNAGLGISSNGLNNRNGEVVSNGAVTLTLGTAALDNAGGLIETAGDISIQAGQLGNFSGQIHAGNGLAIHLPTFHRAASGGELLAGGLLELHTTGDIMMDGDGLSSPGSLWLDAGTATIHIDSRVVSGIYTRLTGAALALGDTAVVTSQGELLVTTDELHNAGVLFGRTGLILQIENLLNLGNADVYQGAALLSEGDISISTQAGEKVGAVNNYGGLIESVQGNITLLASRLLNQNMGWSIAAPYNLPSEFEYSISASSYNSFHHCCGRYGEDVHTSRIETIVTRNDFASRGNAAHILAGGNITLDLGSLVNDHSIISAQGVLDITADSISNQGTTLTDTIRKKKSTRWHTCEYDSLGDLDCWGVQGSTNVSHQAGEVETLPAILEGGSDVIIRATVFNGTPEQIGNTVVSDGDAFAGLAITPDDLPPPGNLSVGIADPTALPGFNLPNNGLFNLSSDPTHPYLIETDPALNTYAGFLGSAYLLAHLEGWAPGVTQRRLGDGYYEITLVREALLASLGSRFLDPAIADEKAQFEYLMNNAIAASESLHLSPGIALTRDQIDALQADIVWMEERVIAGQAVLVPVVYLAQGSSRVLQDGSVISGGALSISGDTFSNAGLVQARDSVSVNTTGLLANLGGEIQGGGNVALQSGTDILNLSGHISGENVALVAEGDITHRTWTTDEVAGAGDNQSWSTAAGATASVVATGNQVQAAGGTLTLTAARLSGGTLSLAAGNGIVMGTAEARQGYRFSTTDWQQAEEHVRHLQTELVALQELRLMTAGNIISSAAWLKGGEVTLEAGGDILLQAVADRDHRELHTRHDGSREDSSLDLVHDAVVQRGTLIEATGESGDVRITAREGGITLDASVVRASGAIAAKAGTGINVLSGINTESFSLVTAREGLTRFSNHQEGYIAQTLAQAGFAAGGDLTLDSHGAINLAAAGLQSGGLLRIGTATLPTDADGNALKDAEGHLVIDRGTVSNINDVALALTNKSWNETQSGYTGPMEELVNVASLLASNFNLILTGGQAELPEIRTGSRSSVQRESQTAMTSTMIGQDVLLSATDSIRLQGTQILATGDVGSAGGGNVSLLAGDIHLEAAESISREQHSSATQTTQALGASSSTGEVQVAGLMITDRSNTVTTTMTTHQGVGIDAGNIALMATGAVDMTAARLIADAGSGRIVIDASTLDIGGVQDTITTTTEERVDTRTLAVGIRNAIVDAVLAAEALAEGIKALKEADEAVDLARQRIAAGTLAPEALDDYQRNRDAAAAHLAYLELAMAAAAATAAASTPTGGFYASGSAQEQSSRTVTTTTLGTWQGSQLSADQIRLTALDSLLITGSALTANTGTLDADNIVVTAGSNTSSQSSYSSTTTQGITVSISRFGTGADGLATTAGAIGSSGNFGISAGSSHSQSQAASTQYVNSRLDFGSLASTSDTLTLAGAVIEADSALITTRDLTITSLQDTSSSTNSSESHSAGLGLGSGGIGGVSGLNGSVGEGSGFSRSQMTGELSSIIVHDGSTSAITADTTRLTGGLIANATRDEAGRLVDLGNLNFVTRTLETHDLFDYSISEQEGFNVGLGISLRPGKPVDPGMTTPPRSVDPDGLTAASIAPGSLTLGATHIGHRTEGSTLATIGRGNVIVLSDTETGKDSLAGVNRDLDNTHLITLDQDTHALDANATLDLRLLTEEGRAQIAREQQAVGRNYQMMGNAIGGEVREAIEAGVGFFQEGEAARITAAKLESWVGALGIIPTRLNGGGLLFGQTPVWLTADDINQRQIIATSKNSEYMRAHPELGWVSISETEGFYLLSAMEREALKNFMVSTVAIPAFLDPSLATYQNSVTGMLNTEALALYNAFLQSGTAGHPENSVFTLNYNPTRGVAADGIESAIDKFATSDFLGLLKTARPFSFLTTTVADQTGAFLADSANARGEEGIHVSCHSQGCILTYGGLISRNANLDESSRGAGNKYTFTVSMYGSPVNNSSMDRYLDSLGLLLTSSTVNDDDFVGESLGGNKGTYIYSTSAPSELGISATQYTLAQNFGNKLNVWNLVRLFTPWTTHARYNCIANCTNEKN